MGFWGFAGVVIIAAWLITWPEFAMRWTHRIIGGLAIYATITLWAVILDPGPPRKTPPIGLVMLEDAGHERTNQAGRR